MTKLCSWWRHLQQRSPRPSGVNHVSSFEDTGAFMNRIDEIVRGSFSSTEKSAEVHEVAFNIKWQIQQCLRDELDGNPDLGPVLTVTGNSLHAWATSCHEYIQATWKEAAIGEQFLIDLEILLGKNFPSLEQQPVSRLRGTLCSVDEEVSGISRLIFKGTVSEISILGQFLSWITASFRIPRAGQLTSSSVDFWDASKQDGSLPAFGISIRELRDLDDCPGTCWRALFPSTIMACGFPVPICRGTFGLRIPFDAMLQMADIMYGVNLKGDGGKDAGVYFDGISYTLYPTAYIRDQHTIQWHLESKNGHHNSGHTHAVAPDHGGKPKWKRISDLEILQSAATILGYCSEVQIQLGTAALAQYHNDIPASQVPIERPPMELAGGSLGIGFSIKGLSNLTASTTWRPRNGLQMEKETAKSAAYTWRSSTATMQIGRKKNTVNFII